jgi:hypothetical protein
MKRTMLRVPGSIPGFLFHFLTSLLQRGKLCSNILFHFLTSLLQRRETVLGTSVSYFNELSTKKRNYAHDFLLIMASKRIMVWKDAM